MKTEKGIALFSILIVAAALLTFLAVGLKLGSDGVLFVSQTHKRNVALSAAEAGVYEAMALLLNDKNYDGTSSGTLPESRASFEVSVVNELFSTRVARVTSTGEYGGVQRTLEVELEPDSGGFQAVAVDGSVHVFDYAYVNGIVSPGNPTACEGMAHTEYDTAGKPSYKGEVYDPSVTSVPRLHGTGELSTRGYFDSALSRTSPSESTNQSKPRVRFDRAELLGGGGFTTASPPLGTLTTSTVVPGPSDPTASVEFLSEVVVPEGVTLHVTGNAKFLGGISGAGNVVVDGDALIRTSADFDPTNEEGLKMLVEGSAFIAHPLTEIRDDDVVTGDFNAVGDFFARMPPAASLDIPVALPTDAPSGGDFFTWFDGAVSAPSPQFNLWYNGDGSDIYPGLTQETKDWLQESRAIHTQITDWADGT